MPPLQEVCQFRVGIAKALRTIAAVIDQGRRAAIVLEVSATTHRRGEAEKQDKPSHSDSFVNAFADLAQIRRSPAETAEASRSQGTAATVLSLWSTAAGISLRS